MKKLLLTLIILLIISCNAKNDEMIIGTCPKHLDIGFRIQAPDGSDLLDEKNPLALDKDKIKVRYVIENGIEVTYDKLMQIGDEASELFQPNGYISKDSIFYIHLFADKKSSLTANSQRKTYKVLIHWNDKVVDTVESWIWFCNKHQTNTSIDKEVLINGKTIWNGDVSNFYKLLNNHPIRVFDYKDLK